MIADKIEIFIDGLIEKTFDNKLIWQRVRMLRDWRRLKAEIKDIQEINWKDYAVSEETSYCMEKGGGYVFLINACYGNAKVFSPALDKLLLILKIDKNAPMENLCAYGAEGVYQEALRSLQAAITINRYEEKPSPDAIYEFMEKVLEEEG